MRRKALHALVRRGHDVEPAVIQALSDPDPGVRLDAATVLAEADDVSDAGLVALLESLTDDRTDVAAVARFGVDFRAPEVIVPLARIMRSGDAGSRVLAARELVRFGPAGAKALAAQLASLEEPTRLLAAESLGAMGPDAVVAGQALGDGVAFDESPKVKRAAAAALRALGAASREFLQSAIDMGDDDGRELAKETLRALEHGSE
jgi:hypothetical protein